MAMILGVSYAEIRATLGDPGNGKTFHLWHNWLGRHGFAYQHVFKFDCATNAERAGWPLKPWAEAHIAAVDAGAGEGSHNVILLRDGTVLDPMRDAPARWEEYTGVSYIGALYDVGGAPL